MRLTRYLFATTAWLVACGRIGYDPSSGLPASVVGGGDGSGNDATAGARDVMAPFDGYLSDAGLDAGSAEANGAAEDASVDVRSENAIPDSQSLDSGGSDGRADADVGAPSGCAGGCTAGGYCSGTVCVYPSCAARLVAIPGSPSAVYSIDPDGALGATPFQAYCEMTLDGGGWTLILKISGLATTFPYTAALWTNAATFQPGSPNLDTTEAKLAGFSTMPFTNLRVGMIQGGTTRWLVLAINGSSLLSAVTGPFKATNAGIRAWEALPGAGSLQTNCTQEGFNVQTNLINMRIGIVGDNQGDCSRANSWIGFGSKGDQPTDPVCGNVANNSPDNGIRSDALFGYVMVR